MNADNVMTALLLLRSNDDLKNADKLVSLLVKPYEGMELSQGDEAKLCLYLAAKANYQLFLADDKEKVKSFKAGEVSISTEKPTAFAKELMDMAYRDVVHIVGTDGFAFLEV